MILKTQPKTFVIVMDNFDISENQYADCEASANINNWKLQRFSATIGTTITQNDWKSIQVNPLLHKKTMDKFGVHGCFFSHFRLWKKCVELNEPIVILEHDAVITAPWPEVFLKDSLIKLHHRFKTMRHDDDSGEWSKSAHAYCLSPNHATKLINFSQTVGAYAPDVMIGTKVVSLSFLNKKTERSLVERQNTYSYTNNL
jgi:hypothetical protein